MAVPVRVACRVRPMSEMEMDNGGLGPPPDCVDVAPPSSGVVSDSVTVSSSLRADAMAKKRSFTLDQIYGHESDQESIFSHSVAPLVDGCFQGYNACVMAYGQTGAGKTFTMGSGGETLEGDHPNAGIIPRALMRIFSKVKDMSDKMSFTVSVSFMELLNEDIRDLLGSQVVPSTPARARGQNPPSTPSHHGGASSTITISEDPKTGETNVVGLKEEEILSVADGLVVLESGLKRRTTASTKMNATSSRSHAVYAVSISGVPLEEPSLDGNGEVDRNGHDKEETEEVLPFRSRFNFVDLAGSERVKKTGAEGSRLKEGISINCGLLALGNVISSLVEAGKKGGGASSCHHIPYRNSKLTRLLKDSLGGNSNTLMIACVSPAESNLEETINTLTYASRARCIQNKPVANAAPSSISPEYVSKLREEIKQLKSQLTGRPGSSVSLSSSSSGLGGVHNNNGDGIGGEMHQMLIGSLQTSQAKAKQYHSEAKELKAHLEQVLECVSDSLRMLDEDMLNQYKDIREWLLVAGSGGVEDVAEPDQVGRDIAMKGVTLMDKVINCLRDLKVGCESMQLQTGAGLQSKRTASDGDGDGDGNEEGEGVDDEDGEGEGDGNGSFLSEGSSISSDVMMMDTEGGEEIRKLDGTITAKESLLENLIESHKQMVQMKETYEKRLTEMEMGRLKLEKEVKQKEKQARSKEDAARIRKEYELKLKNMKKTIDDLQKKKREHELKVKKEAKNRDQIELLRTEILKMKQQKVQLSRQIKMEATSHRDSRLDASRQIHSLRKEGTRKDVKIKNLERESRRHRDVAKRRADALDAANTKLREAERQLVSLARQSVKQTQQLQRSQASSGKSIPHYRQPLAPNRKRALNNEDLSNNMKKPRGLNSHNNNNNNSHNNSNLSVGDEKENVMMTSPTIPVVNDDSALTRLQEVESELREKDRELLFLRDQVARTKGVPHADGDGGDGDDDDDEAAPTGKVEWEKKLRQLKLQHQRTVTGLLEKCEVEDNRSSMLEQELGEVKEDLKRKGNEVDSLTVQCSDYVSKIRELESKLRRFDKVGAVNSNTLAPVTRVGGAEKTTDEVVIHNGVSATATVSNGDAAGVPHVTSSIDVPIRKASRIERYNLRRQQLKGDAASSVSSNPIPIIRSSLKESAKEVKTVMMAADSNTVMMAADSKTSTMVKTTPKRHRGGANTTPRRSKQEETFNAIQAALKQQDERLGAGDGVRRRATRRMIR